MLGLGGLRARCGLGALLRVATGLLRALALNVDSRHTQGIPVLVYLFTGVMIAIYLYVYQVSIYWYILARGGDTLASVVVFSLAVASLIGVVKLLFMYWNSNKLKQLVSEYLQCDAAVVPDSRMSRAVQATLARVRRRALVFWVLMIGNGVLYVLQPLLTPGRHLLEDRQVLWGLEPMFESPNYEIAYIVECFGVFLAVYPSANITVFLIIIVGYSEAQLLALAQELLHLWDDAQWHYQQNATSYEGTIDTNSIDNDLLDIGVNRNVTIAFHDSDKSKNMIINNYIKQRLETIMKMHAININLIKEVERLFQSSIATEFALLSAGLIVELLGGLENTYMEVPFALAQVSMDCITGQKLIDANKMFEDAVYDCKWENFDVTNMKLVMVMLQNAQKTMTLSAGGVISLSYFSLMSIIKSIFSAYTTLRSTMK